MFSPFRNGLAAIVGCTICLGALQPAIAQHHGGHHGGSHHGGHYGGHYGTHHGGHYGSAHHGGHYGGWGHVVPSHHHHAGLYYSYGGANYYTPVPPPLQVQVMRPPIDGQPITMAPPADPIAPQSVRLEFGGFQQIEDLSNRLVIEVNRWCLDLHYNYPQNLDFSATYGDAYQILQAAKYVRGADHRGDREAIRKQLAVVESQFHQIQATIKTWDREERRPVGPDDINGKTALVESILHHLLYDVGVAPQHAEAAEEEAPPPQAAELLPSAEVKQP